MKLCLACSVGGHLTQMLQLEELFRKYDHYFLSFKNERTIELAKKEKVRFVTDPERKIFQIFKSFKEGYDVLKKENPDVIITTGAGIALPTIILGKLMKKKIITIESFSRITKPSLFGRIAYNFSDLFLVQWKGILKYYPKAVYTGPVFDFSKIKTGRKGGYIFLTVGNHYASFHRLIKKLDDLISEDKIKQRVIAQIGPSSYIPKNFKWFRYLNSKIYIKYIKNSDFVITHGGISSIVDCIKYNKKCIVVPRYKRFKEHINDHQLDITQEMKNGSMIIPVYNIEDLEDSIEKIKRFKIGRFHENSKMLDIIEKNIEKSRNHNINV